MSRSCPSPEQWRAFHQGLVDEDQLTSMAEHLERCFGCQGVLRSLGDAPDSFCESLKTALRNQVVAPDSVLTATAMEASVTEPPWIPSPGQSLGRFEVLERIGAGSFGVVYRARDPMLQRDVAVKIPQGRTLATEEGVRGFLAEAAIAAGLSHPHLLAVYDSGVTQGIAYIAVEYCAGPNLAEWILEQKKPIGWYQAAQLTSEIAKAVAYAHRCGLLHRDIKPSNVFLQPVDRGGILTNSQGVGFVPKLGDFGLATGIRTEAEPFQSGRGDGVQAVGTPHYMAPEIVLLGAQAATTASDVHSLGVMLFQLLTGSFPFSDGGFIETLRRPSLTLNQWPRSAEWVPLDLKAVCLKCLEKSPAKRYRDAGQLADDLDNLLGGQPVQARPRGLAETALSWGLDHPSRVALALVVAIGFLFWMHQSAEYQNQLSLALNRLEISESKARAHLFATQMRLVQTAMEAREHHQASQYLEQAAVLASPPFGPENPAPFEWRYLRAQLPQTPKRPALWAHPGGVTALAFHKSSRLLASAGNDGQIALWSVPEWKLVRRWDAHDKDINSVVWVNEGRRIASCGDDGFVRIWDVDTGKNLKEMRQEGRLFELVASPDQSTLISAGDGESIVFWDGTTGDRIRALAGRRVRALATLDSRGGLAWAEMEQGLHSLEPNNAESARSYEDSGHHRINDIAVAPGGETIAAGTRDGRILYWRRDRGTLIASWKAHIDAVHTLRFHPEGNRLISSSSDRTVAIWNGPDQLHTRFQAGPSAQWSMDRSPDGLWIATGDRQGWLRITPWDSTRVPSLGVDLVVPGNTLGRFGGWVGPKTVVRTTSKGAFELGEIDDGREFRVMGNSSDATDLIDLFPVNQADLLIGATRQGMLVGWSLTTGELRWRTPTLGGRVFDLRSVGGAKEFITVQETGEVVLRSCTGGHPQGNLWRHQDLALCLAQSPLGEKIATGGEDRTIRFGGKGPGTPSERVISHRSVVSALTFLDEDRLVSGDHDGKVLEWDLTTGIEVAVFPGTHDRVLALCLSPDRTTLVASCRGGKIVFWNRRSRQPTLTIDTGSETAVRDVSFSPDGQWLLALVAEKAGRAKMRLFPAPF